MNHHCSVEMLANSINAIGGARLTTFLVQCPLRLHTALLSCRDLTVTQSHWEADPRGQVHTSPVGPAWEDFPAAQRPDLQDLWHTTALDAWETDQALQEAGMPPGQSQLLLAPFAVTYCLVSATDWNEFFHQATVSPDRDLRDLAWQIADLYYRYGSPTNVRPGGWHIPLLPGGDAEQKCIADYLARHPFTAEDPQWLPQVTPECELALRWAAGRLDGLASCFLSDLHTTISHVRTFPIDVVLDSYPVAPLASQYHIAQATLKRDYRASNLAGWNTLQGLHPLDKVPFDYQARRQEAGLTA